MSYIVISSLCHPLHQLILSSRSCFCFVTCILLLVIVIVISVCQLRTSSTPPPVSNPCRYVNISATGVILRRQCCVRASMLMLNPLICMQVSHLLAAPCRVHVSMLMLHPLICLQMSHLLAASCRVRASMLMLHPLICMQVSHLLAASWYLVTLSAVHDHGIADVHSFNIVFSYSFTFTLSS